MLRLKKLFSILLFPFGYESYFLSIYHIFTFLYKFSSKISLIPHFSLYLYDNQYVYGMTIALLIYPLVNNSHTTLSSSSRTEFTAHLP